MRLAQHRPDRFSSPWNNQCRNHDSTRIVAYRPSATRGVLRAYVNSLAAASMLSHLPANLRRQPRETSLAKLAFRCVPRGLGGINLSAAMHGLFVKYATYRKYLCILTLALHVGITGDVFAVNVAASYPADVACGPRCVRFILQENGVASVFDEIVNELLGQDEKRGATLASLASAIERRGLYVRCGKTDSFSLPVINSPCIVHLNRPGSDLGHYVVLMPWTDVNNVRIWNGLSGVEVLRGCDLISQMSGYFLCASPSPFGTAPLAASMLVCWDGTYLPTHIVAGIVGILGLSALVTRSMDRRRFHR